MLVDNINTRHRNAQMAGRASVELYTLIYFYGRSVLADARVLQVGHAFGACRWPQPLPPTHPTYPL